MPATMTSAPDGLPGRRGRRRGACAARPAEGGGCMRLCRRPWRATTARRSCEKPVTARTKTAKTVADGADGESERDMMLEMGDTPLMVTVWSEFATGGDDEGSMRAKGLRLSPPVSGVRTRGPPTPGKCPTVLSAKTLVKHPPPSPSPSPSSFSPSS